MRVPSSQWMERWHSHWLLPYYAMMRSSLADCSATLPAIGGRCWGQKCSNFVPKLPEEDLLGLFTLLYVNWLANLVVWLAFALPVPCGAWIKWDNSLASQNPHERVNLHSPPDQLVQPRVFPTRWPRWTAPSCHPPLPRSKHPKHCKNWNKLNNGQTSSHSFGISAQFWRANCSNRNFVSVEDIGRHRLV